MFYNGLVIVRGGGDLATGTVHRLWKSGFRVLVLEARDPAAIRRHVAVCEAVFQGRTEVEGMTAVRIDAPEEAAAVIDRGQIPVLVDPRGESIPRLRPFCVVDAIIAKKNLGTHRGMAPLTIALGPGFTVGTDCDFVIETNRGHNLGRVITEGAAAPNTGVPGIIAGHGADRVIHAPATGTLRGIRKIGDLVQKGEAIAEILPAGGDGSSSVETQAYGGGSKMSAEPRIAGGDGNSSAAGCSAADIRTETEGVRLPAVPVPASLTGVLRGLIRDGYPVTEGLKIADIDPRPEQRKNCYTISDKARCIAGSVLEVVCGYLSENEKK